MNDKALFTAKLLFTLALIAGLCALATAEAEWFESRQVTAHGGLNVRAEPCIESEAVYLLEETEVVVVHEWRHGWALVGKNIGDHRPIGWACGDYLK